MSAGALRGLPHSWDTEAALLGGLLISGESLDDVRDGLGADDFHRPAHAALWTLICEMADRRIAVDLTTVCEQIDARGTAEAVGGVSHVCALPNACASVDNLPTYARRLSDLTMRRRLIIAAREQEEAAHDMSRSADDLLDAAQERVFGLSTERGSQDATPIGAVLDDRVRAAAKRAETPGRIAGITTGFIDLDRALRGMEGGELIIVGGSPGTGKTMFAYDLACQVARGQCGVLGFQLEMTKAQLGDRHIISGARLNSDRFTVGEINPDTEWRRILDLLERDRGMPLCVDDTPGLTISQLRGRARRHKARHPDTGLIFVDYLQLIRGTKGPKQSEEQVIADAALGLSEMAKELGVPVIALSQFNRDFHKRANKRPETGDLRGSGFIEQAANVILMLYRDEMWNEETVDRGIAEVIIRKQRRGPLSTIRLAFIGAEYRYANLDERRSADASRWAGEASRGEGEGW